MLYRSRFCFELFLWLFWARAQANVADAEVNIDTTIEEHMRKDADLSQFYSLLQREVVANNTLQHEAVTIFAPINEAFQKLGLGKEDDPRLVRYHLINVPRTSNNLGDLKKPIALPSELPG
ncbi:fasciclin-1-like, partial [Agrilus planipennis]|uniref:Fasciclin-1-like n=1 Tax=Agrilus planipennis TaxID=224129 RepID=A0A7F5R8Z1_AGRPL